MSVFDALATRSPLTPLVLMGCAILLLAVAGRKVLLRPSHFAALTALGLSFSLLSVLRTEGSVLGATVLLDGFGVVFGSTVLLGSLLSVLVSVPYLEEHRMQAAEYYGLLLLTAAGMLILVYAGDLMTLFVGLELMAFGVCFLSAFDRSSRKSQEAALKYFVYGAYAAAFALFGIALIYGEVGRISAEPSLVLSDVVEVYSSGAVSVLGWAGAGLLVAGLCFEVAVAPFHMWAPDVYEGAPTPTTAFIAAGAKAAAFAALLRVVAATMAGDAIRRGTFVQALEVIAVSTMVIGNLLALRQTSVKRLLAYASVAHAGYVCVGLVAFVASPESGAVVAIAYYLVAYGAMSVGAFGVVLAFEGRESKPEGPALEDITGMARTHRALGLAMAVFMLALAGIPPSAGFFGRFALFAAAIESGRWPLVLVAALASVVGAACYLRVMALVFAPPAESRVLHSPWLSAGLWMCAGVSLLGGLAPEPYLAFARAALVGWLPS